MDKELNDDNLKLVRSKILFVKRDYEHAFPEQEELLSEKIDEPTFTAWKINEFLLGLARGETLVPKKWVEKNYPTDDDDRRRCVKGGRLIGLPEEDKQYLRVVSEILERFPQDLERTRADKKDSQ